MRRYRIYAARKDLEAAEPRARVIETHAGFLIAEGPASLLAALRARWPVEPLADAAPRATPAAPLERGLHHYVVSLDAPADDTHRRALEKAGAMPVESRGARALLIEGNPGAMRRVRGLPFVSGLERYDQELPPGALERARESDRRGRRKGVGRPEGAQPVPRLPRRAAPVLPLRYKVTFFSGKELRDGLARVREKGCKVLSKPDAKRARVLIELPLGEIESTLKDIAAIHGVKRVEEQTVPRARNDVALGILNTAASTSARGLGLTGRGEVVAVADSGLDSGRLRVMHPDLDGRILGMKSYPIDASYDRDVKNRRADDGVMDKNSGHGTHVAGSILGTGAAARDRGLRRRIRGLAHEAKLFFQAIEQEVDWTDEFLIHFHEQNDEFPERFALAGLPANDISPLFADAHRAGARIHSNSWGGGVPADYDSQCDDVDRFIWEHKDFTILFAAGNSGQDPGGKGSIELGSIDPPGTAKNCITVGMSESRRLDKRHVTYGDFWPLEFPRAPFHDDPMADDPEHISARSSRGPTRDGRWKPDVVAPGTFILSLRSRFLARNQWAWGKFGPCREYFFMGGTSMSTPLVAGAAALVRERLRGLLRSPPSAALIKAVLIHGARRLRDPHHKALPGVLADNHQGWGRLDLDASLVAARARSISFIDRGAGLRTGERAVFPVAVRSPAAPFKATLVWSDFPGQRLVNNLTLLVRLPGGKYLAGNDFADKGELDRANNVESVLLENPAPGAYTIEVVGSEVQEGPQDFALVYSADAAPALEAHPWRRSEGRGRRSGAARGAPRRGRKKP